MIKKVIKSGGYRARFDVKAADKNGYLGHFGKTRALPKTRQKGEISSMIHVVSHRI